MAYSALMSGLIGAGMAAGDDAKERMTLANKEASMERLAAREMDMKKQLYIWEKEMDAEAKKRIDENIRGEEQRLQAGQAAGQINQSLGSNVTSEDVLGSGLMENAAARRAYGLQEPTDIDRLRTRAQAEMNVGESAKDTLGLLNVERQFKADEKRFEVESTRNQQNFEKNMKILERQINSQERASDKAELQAQMKEWEMQYKDAAQQAEFAHKELTAINARMDATPEEKAAALANYSIKSKRAELVASSSPRGSSGKAAGSAAGWDSSLWSDKQPGKGEGAAVTPGSATATPAAAAPARSIEQIDRDIEDEMKKHPGKNNKPMPLKDQLQYNPRLRALVEERKNALGKGK